MALDYGLVYRVFTGHHQFPYPPSTYRSPLSAWDFLLGLGWNDVTLLFRVLSWRDYERSPPSELGFPFGRIGLYDVAL